MACRARLTYRYFSAGLLRGVINSVRDPMKRPAVTVSNPQHIDTENEKFSSLTNSSLSKAARKPFIFQERDAMLQAGYQVVDFSMLHAEK